MERFTISIDSDLAPAFDALIAARGVRHGKLDLVAVELGQRHAHGCRPRGHGGSNHHAPLKAAR